MPTNIIWADDEIDQLKGHILFLEEKGFEIHPVTNGQDALDLVRSQEVDLVFLDEQMPGMDGLQTLEQIKESNPLLPVVMITKSEEESIMEDAIGRHIADYLIKPVNPNQILLTIKRVLDRQRIQSESASQRYLRSFNQLSSRFDETQDWADWVEIYRQLVRWELDLEDGEETLKEILENQRQQANTAFSKMVTTHYKEWIQQKEPDHRPLFSHEIFKQYVHPLLNDDRPTIFLLIDCMRYDQWLKFEQHLTRYYQIDTQFYSSILPTATPYSRNAIFAGLTPLQIQKNYPNLWEMGTDENSLNKHEEELLNAQLKRQRIETAFRYRKVLHADEGKKLLNQLSDYLQVPLSVFIFNFVDTLVHSRSDSDVLRELSPDARAFRSLADSWFQHSTLFQILRELSESNARIVVTTDHGSVRAMRDTKVFGDRHAAVSLRYKHGRSLDADDESATFVIQRPQDFELPVSPHTNSYLIAKEDFYFVYPTQYHKFQNKYRDTFQHGGISMEEMILPVAILTPKKG